MEPYQIITLCGIPTIVSIVWSAIFKKLFNKIKSEREATEQLKKDKESAEMARYEELEKGIEQLKLATQALLRSELYSLYHTYKPIGHVPSHVAENFENIWNRYHTIAVNGIMDEVYDRFHEFEVDIDV